MLAGPEGMQATQSQNRLPRWEKEKHSAGGSSSCPPAEDCTVHRITLLPDGRLPQTSGNLVPAPPGNLVCPPGLPSSARESGLPWWEKEKHGAVNSSTWPPAEDCTV